MKRSLPVMLGIAAVLVIVLLVGGGFLSLPVGDDDSSLADVPERESAPQVDPDPMDVAVDGDLEEVDENDKDKRKKKDSKGKKKARSDRPGKKDGKQGGAPSGGTSPRSAPDGDGRKAPKKGSGVKVPDKTNEPNKNPKPPAPVVVSDLRGDPEGEGEAPAFMDLEGVRVAASGNSYVVDLTFAGALPSALNKGQAMVATIEVNRGDRKVSAYAEGTERGWQASTNRPADGPTSTSIEGRTISFTVPRSFFGNQFGFYAHSNWTRSTLGGTDYFFDFAPDDENGRYPSGGTT